MGRPGRQLKLAGVFAAAVTPNRPGTLDVDYSPILDTLDFLTDAGLDGLCLMGSTGEFVNFSFGDRQRLVYLAAKRSRVPLIVGVSHSTLNGALTLADEAISAGADGLLLMPPYFFPYPQSEIEHFFREFARETGDAVPLILYNIPLFTSAMEIATVRRLLDTGLFAGIKDSSGDWAYLEQLLALKRERPFALLVGSDRIALRALREGADGVVSGCACAVPELLAKLYKTRDDRVNDLLTEFVEWVDKFPPPVAIKRAVELRGHKSGSLSIPLSPDAAAELARFSAWFKEFIVRA